MLLENCVTIRNLGLVNTLPAIALPYLASAFGIFLLRQTFKSIPKDFEEAARVEGCSTLGVLWRVYVPLGKRHVPGLRSGAGELSLDVLAAGHHQLGHQAAPDGGAGHLRLGRSGHRLVIHLAATLMTSGPLLIHLLRLQRQFVPSFMQTGIRQPVCS
jgi:sn-glycerol 3-phosphate transport system permease protein